MFLYLVCLILSRLFIAALWSPAGKGLSSWPMLVMVIVFLYFPMWYPGLGVVLDCIVSLSLSSFLLFYLCTTSSHKTKQFIRINMLQQNKENDL